MTTQLAERPPPTVYATNAAPVDNLAYRYRPVTVPDMPCRPAPTGRCVTRNSAVALESGIG